MSSIIRRSFLFKSPPPLSEEEQENLKQNRKKKQTKFAWLANFLRARPSQKTLKDKGIIG